MRSRFDQFVKQLLRAALEPAGRVQTEREVSPDAQRIDVWFTPSAEHARMLKPLGLLRRITALPCVLEHFHCTPGTTDIGECQRKHANNCHILAREHPGGANPLLWVLSSGRPTAALKTFDCRPLRGWPTGIYAPLPVWRLRVVVIHELPRVRSTLLLRLMGAGRTLKKAIAELHTLPTNARERYLATPILLRLRLDVPQETAKRTEDDQEFLMDTEDIVARWEQNVREEGLQKGLAPARRAFVMLYGLKFGPMPATLRRRAKTTTDPDAINRWCDLVARGTRKEVDQAISKQKPRAL
jgi:hypothetical protein